MQWGPESIILPDFQVSGGRFNVFADSKAKRHPVVYRHAQEERHGINRRNWEHYATIAERSGQVCCIAIFECFRDEEVMCWSGALLLQSLPKLGFPPATSGRTEMVFWPRRSFINLGSLDPEQARQQRSYTLAGFRAKIWEALELSAQGGKQGVMF